MEKNENIEIKNSIGKTINEDTKNELLIILGEINIENIKKVIELINNNFSNYIEIDFINCFNYIKFKKVEKGFQIIYLIARYKDITITIQEDKIISYETLYNTPRYLIDLFGIINSIAKNGLSEYRVLNDNF